ncbi:GNAT family N-acetyltransferase [Corynebacterium comes]|uniref:N-acetyltransferase domain-containing protein n=1 Tax=Corynebacterium comes TaxID=2675218 RepID=A0A6B8VHW0_9CORY|nr:GNAT family N-acetyltransferase [Corynebacterium comes]QGU03753.1 hypothetical protein CETAM_02365 [Corynebacterium comes]
MSHAIHNDTPHHRYVLTVNGQEAGFLNYLQVTGTIDLARTEISEQFSGQGMAADLALHAFEDIHRRELNVLISCPAVRSFLNQHPRFLDMVVEP